MMEEALYPKVDQVFDLVSNLDLNPAELDQLIILLMGHLDMVSLSKMVAESNSDFDRISKFRDYLIREGGRLIN